jgi:hypothetical protein
MKIAIVMTLFDRRPRIPYCGMTVLNAISIRKHEPDIPVIVCDYSQNAQVDASLAQWSHVLGFEVRKFVLEKDPAAFALTDALSLRYDAVLQLAASSSLDRLICIETDMLVTGPVSWLAEGDYDAKFLDRSSSVPEGVAVSDALVAVNLASEKALRLVALTRSLHQADYVWQHLRGLTVSPASGYSERLVEVAARLLNREGFGGISWREFSACCLHHARHNQKDYPTILAHAEEVLDGSGYAARFTAEFGDLEDLIFRETTGKRAQQ